MGRQGRHRPAGGRRRLSLPAPRDRRPRPPAREPRAHARDLDRRAARRSARGLDPRPQLRSCPMSAPRSRFAAPVVLVLVLAARASASTSGADAAAALREAGDRYESGRLLAGAARLDALEQSESALRRALHGGLPDDRRAAAELLLGTIRRDLGDFRTAADAFRDAERARPAGPFAGDAAFAAIEAMEASGDDAEAAKQWPRWEKRFPASPLVPCAELAFAWNALRRGDTAAARRSLDLLEAGAPWLASDPRARLARAFAAPLENRPPAPRPPIGQTLADQGHDPEAIVELNKVLTSYFKHSVAASAQYRVARSLDAMGRHADATGSYEAVVAGYPLEPEAPAAAYLAGVGLLEQNRPRAAAPYFQIVLDRYAARRDSSGS